MVKELEKILKPLLLVSLLLVAVPSWAKQLIAEVSSTQIEEGDVLQLLITANFQTTHKPDFSVLEQDFTLHGTSASTQYRLVNGTYSATTQWEVQLTANKLGELEIPSFRVKDVSSDPISLVVTQASQDFDTSKVSFLDAQIDNPNPYVQAEVIYTLRFYHQGQLQRGSVAEPKFDKFISERISNQNTFETTIKDVRYRVYEWVYVLYPQESGKLTIAPQEFEGTIYLNRKILHTDQKSQEITLDVKPIPSSYPQDAKWLPAKKLTLKDKWHKPTVIEQNSAIEREIFLTALGVKTSHLPSFPEESNSNYRIYNETPLPTERLVGSSISSSLYQKQMYLMHTAGKTPLPAQKVYWWNTQDDKLEIAELAAEELEVIPTSSEKTVELDTPLPVEDALDNLQETEAGSSEFNLWTYLTFAFALAWIATLIAYFIRKNTTAFVGQKTDTPEDVVEEPLLIQATTDQGYYLEVQKTLVEKYQVSDWRVLDQSYQELKEALSLLEKQIFSEEKAVTQEQKDSLENLLKSQLGQLSASNKSKKQTSKLAPLYP